MPDNLVLKAKGILIQINVSKRSLGKGKLTGKIQPKEDSAR